MDEDTATNRDNNGHFQSRTGESISEDSLFLPNESLYVTRIEWQVFEEYVFEVIGIKHIKRRDFVICAFDAHDLTFDMSC